MIERCSQTALKSLSAVAAMKNIEGRWMYSVKRGVLESSLHLVSLWYLHNFFIEGIYLLGASKGAVESPCCSIMLEIGMGVFKPYCGCIC